MKFCPNLKIGGNGNASKISSLSKKFRKHTYGVGLLRLETMTHWRHFHIDIDHHGWSCLERAATLYISMSFYI